MKKLLMTLCVILAMVLHTESNVYATEAETELSVETEANTDSAKSVLQMVVLYMDDAGNSYPVQGGCGFLIGDEEATAEYMITAKEVTQVSEETEQQIKEAYVSQEDYDKELTYKIKAVVRRDVMIDVGLVAESEEMGFAIWKLSQPLHDRQALVIHDGEIAASVGQTVAALGFPTAPELGTEAVYYTKEEIISKEGRIIGDTKEGNVKYLYHNVEGTTGMIGGPVLNEDGQVIALYQSKQTEEGHYALQMSELLSVLEALGIPYVTSSEIEAQRQAELAAMVHKEELQKMIEAANKIVAKEYTKASYDAMTQVLADAVTIDEDEAATQEMVDSAVEQLSVMITSLKEKPPTWIFIVIAVMVLLIFGSVFSIVWMRTAESRELKKQQRYEEFTVTEAPPVFVHNTTVRKADYKELVAGNSKELNDRYKVPQGNNNASTQIPTVSEAYQELVGGDTTVFTQDMGDTVVLHYEEPKKKKTACLTRTRTGEKINIIGNEFVIGKDPSQTDYNIVGNSAISRAHAVLIQNETEYEVADKNATNGTFVNGVKVEAFQKVIIKDGDVLRLADEDFTFQIIEEA